MPELRDPAPDWQQLRHLPQRACPGCSARHPGGHVVRFFAHHEFVCTRHGYWIGPPLPTMPDLRPRQFARQIPELVTAQHRHNRLLRRRGWRHVVNAIDVSTSVCIDQRFCEPIDAPLRRCWQQRIDLLIPNPGWFNTSVFLAAFYPEIVNLARLFCSPSWRRIADEALTSTTHRQAITAEITGAIGREPHPPALPSYEVHRWLRAMVDDPIHVRLTYTFPQTRRVTPDGVPIKCSGTEENRARKAAKEFGKHRHVPTWALPHYVSRPTGHDTPIGYQPSEHDERPDLSQLLTTLAIEGAN